MKSITDDKNLSPNLYVTLFASVIIWNMQDLEQLVGGHDLEDIYPS